MSTTNLYCAIYRTGGTLNFKWHRTLDVSSYQQAQLIAGDLRTMGYPAHVENYCLSLSVGLPETFAVGGGPIDPEDYIEYEERGSVRSMARMEDLPQD